MIASTPLEAFYYWEKNSPDQPFLRQPLPGQWKIYTYKQAGIEIRKVANALKALHLAPQSKIAILSKNCAHWIMADLAIWMAGYISVPIYPTLSATGIQYIVEHSEAKAIFIGKLDDFGKQRAAIASSVHKISFPFYGPNEGSLWDDLLNTSPLAESPLPAAIDIASIMYSSGTTGTPKGVVLTFGAFDFVAKSLAKNLYIHKPEQFFSYLPLSHIAERSYIEMLVFYSGSTISFTESLDKFGDNLREVQPTLFGGVPRIFAKIQEGVLLKMPQQKLDRLLSIPIVSWIVKKTIRKKLGFSKTHLIVGGAAPIPVPLLTWFAKLGIEIREVYGMTENGGYSHGNHGTTVKIGTVGKPWPDIETKFTAEGEILTKHAGLMLGYYKDEESTRQSFTSDGFLKTGDKGIVDADGYLTITGRVKDQFKTDKAKFIAPAPIEMKFTSNKDIDSICVVGMGIPQPIALVVLSGLATGKSKAEIVEGLQATLDAVNATLEHYERIEKVVVLSESWTIENGFITPSLKVKRHEIEKVHAASYIDWYKQKDKILWS
ncbi:AMP-binding protein [Ohtaekwangia koreensis]|uniref:Long-chain acyl-CoA synthetase n=1 Tax=Ohtaekwangia koreensis TaxID=688867 RepID=A0A1T5LJ77_9BACT|nr:AMP-binding protein [Ohtaekwangia koreensis]SKC75855.1 long-chain acyl-CoA synthetase [Ohtaekwangia koreensis]